MNMLYVKSVLAMALMIFVLRAEARTPPDEGVNESLNASEAGSTDVAYCTTGRCFNQVNVNLLSGNRYQELMRVTNIADPNQPLPRQESAPIAK